MPASPKHQSHSKSLCLADKDLPTKPWSTGWLVQAQAHQGGTFNIIANKTILYRFDQKSAHRETHGHNFPAHKHYQT